MELNKALEIASQTIGFGLEPVKPKGGDMTDISLDGKKRPPKVTTESPFLSIDPNKKVNLSKEEWKIIESHGISGRDIVNGWIEVGVAKTDDNIIIVRTDKQSWMALAGREWHLNRKTKSWCLSVMN